MAVKKRKFVDDGWAIWIDGEDVSTVYLNDWLNPKGKSYVDLAIHIRGIKESNKLSVYIPFNVSSNEIEDISLQFKDRKVIQGVFSTACIIDYMKNEYTSEIAYNGKVVDIIHISTVGYSVNSLSNGTLISVDLGKIQSYIDNDEAYIIWRIPHKSLDEIFRPGVDVKKTMSRLIDLITTPVISNKYSYSIRINEARMLPDEITKISTFHRQKLKKAVITISISEDYEINDSSCYKIRRLEDNLFNEYLPKGFKSDSVITYQWNQNRDYNLKGQFNFFYNVYQNKINVASMIIYLIILLAIGVAGELLSDLVKILVGWNF